MDTAVEQVKLATGDEELQFKALSEFSDFLADNFNRENIPPQLGSARGRIIKRVTSNPDPYEELKKRANEAAADLETFARQVLERANQKENRLGRALQIAAAANSMEFGVSGHEFDPGSFREEFESVLDEDMGVDDSAEIASEIASAGDILYLTDNCGEIILDRVLMDEIVSLDVDLYIGAKSRPIQEDVTVKMVERMGFDEFGEIFSAGGKVGIFPDEVSSELWSKLEDSDLVISKGMGNFETISEFEEKLEGRLAYLLRAKCTPVARSFGVERGELVVSFL